MNEEKQDTNLKWEEAKNFERTPPKQSVFFVLVQGFLPGLFMWFLLGNDVHINFLFNLYFSPWWVWMIVILIYVLWGFVTFFIPYKLRLTYLDQLAYLIPIIFAFSALLITSYFNETLAVFWRFLIIFSATLLISVLTNIIIVYLRLKKYNKTQVTK